MTKDLVSTTAVAATFAILSLSFPVLGFAQDVIGKRQDLMESADKANKVIRVAVKEKDYDTVEINAKDIADQMAAMLELFPKGSLSEKSEAHPDIWNRWDEFKSRAEKARAAAEALRRAAIAKDEAQVLAQVKAVGGMASGACGGCHLSFNKKRMKK